MIFVDANVLMYAVGGPHEVRDEVRERFASTVDATADDGLATSAEMMQELLHRYVPGERWVQLDAALRLVEDRMTVWPATAEDVVLARRLVDRHPALTARDLVHLATCINQRATGMWTYDRGLAAAWHQR